MRRVCPMCGARDAVIVKDPDGDWCSCGNCGGVHDFDTTRGTFAESHALEGEIVSVEPLRGLIVPEDFDRPLARRTADAELREAVERLTECHVRTLDALSAHCRARAELPPVDHVSHERRLREALSTLEGQLDEAKAVLLTKETS